MRRIANSRKVKTLICYLLAGLIPFMLAVAAYMRITDIMYDEALSSHIARLHHKQELMDSFLFSVRSIGYAISNDDAVDAIASLDHISGTDTSLLRDAAEMTIGNTLFDPIQRQVLCGYYVLYSNSRVILNLTSKSAF